MRNGARIDCPRRCDTLRIIREGNSWFADATPGKHTIHAIHATDSANGRHARYHKWQSKSNALTLRHVQTHRDFFEKNAFFVVHFAF